MTTTTTAVPVWINNNGEVVCETHAGFHLRSQIAASPNRASYDTPIERWVREDSGQVACESCAPQARRSQPVDCAPHRHHCGELEVERKSARNAIHSYGRARAASDFTWGSGLPEDEVVSRLQATIRAYENAIAKSLLCVDPTVSARDAFDAISAFSSSLLEYGSRRHAGEGPDAADEVLAALEVLIALGSAQQ